MLARHRASAAAVLSNRRQGFLWFRRNRHIALLDSVDHPATNRPAGFFAPGFPKKLAVGESASVYFLAEAPKQWVEENDLFYFGFADTFGRYHWCSRRNAKRFREEIVKDFGAVEPKRSTRFEKIKIWVGGRAKMAASV
jgi:hypothetical protein